MNEQVKIAPGWTIERVDELNWAIQPSRQRKGGNRTWYYGSLIAAIRAIPIKMISTGDVTTLKTIENLMRDIEEMISKALYKL